MNILFQIALAVLSVLVTVAVILTGLLAYLFILVGILKLGNRA